MTRIQERLAQAFVCPKCGRPGAEVEKLAMSGTGLSRFFDIQRYRYAFVSCTHCGYTETYNLKTLEGSDDVGYILDILFSS